MTEPEPGSAPKEDESKGSRRLWCGAFGGFIGALVGLIWSPSLGGALCGMVAGFLVGLVAGLAGIEALAWLWP